MTKELWQVAYVITKPTSLRNTSFSTRKHSSRMHTTRLTTICASVATRCQYCWGCPQVNKFGQVSSDGHQVSLAVVWARKGLVPCLMFRGGGCTVRLMQCNGHMRTPPEQHDRQTPVKKLPFQQQSQ